MSFLKKTFFKVHSPLLALGYIFQDVATQKIIRYLFSKTVASNNDNVSVAKKTHPSFFGHSANLSLFFTSMGQPLTVIPSLLMIIM